MYLVFIGQLNTTSGTPHKVTGRHNIYGDLKAFKTKKERDKFYNEYIPKGFETCVKTNKGEAKVLYFAGCTQVQFNEYLAYLELN